MEGCLHCGNEVPTGSRHTPYCCAGCREVYALIHGEGLGKFYELGGQDGVPVEPGDERPQAWLMPLVEGAEEGGAGLCRLDLDVQGIHCAGCVWLINEMFKRRDGGASITVNPTLGKVQMLWRKGAFDVGAFVAGIERFGYRFGPSQKKAQRASRDLPLRIGISAALTMNVMIFSVSFHAGLAPDEPEIFDLFGRLSLWLATGVVVIGGWPFFKAAFEGVKRRVLHLDLPIAAGILLAYGTSLVQAQGGRGDLAYFDTLCTFTTLMLIGRWLQERLLHRNRRFLLDDAGADGIHVRVRTGDQIRVTTAPHVQEGDLLVVAPGDLVPVDAVLEEGVGLFSTDWITGESVPRKIAVGESVPAGSFNAGVSAREMRARTGFESSPLPQLLQAGQDAGTSPRSKRVELFARWYVPAVLTLSVLGFFLWWGEGTSRALDVTVALLVVTCPCAIGIALPLATQMGLANLRRSGVFVRAGDLLERALSVKHVLFDKTGTLTLGRLEIENEETLDTLDGMSLRVLHALSGRSNHPVSRATAEALRRRLVPFEPGEVIEVPGEGVEILRGDERWRFGRASWACDNSPRDDLPSGTALSRDGKSVCVVRTREAMRVGAREEIEKLESAGAQVWLVSGDEPERAQAAATLLGIDPARTRGGCRPEDKAVLVAELDRGDTLFVGDGVNDALAFEKATCTGTPAVDRPVMPAKADFFLLGEGVGGVRALVETAFQLKTTVRVLFVAALTYNFAAVVLSLIGWMTPLRAAVFMPLSSVTLLLLVVHQMQNTRTASKKPVASAAIAQEAA